MEPPREQHSATPGPGSPESGYVLPAQYTVGHARAPRRAGPLTIFARTLRLILRRVLYVLVILLRPLRPYAGFVVVIAALLGVVAWMGYQQLAPGASAPADPRVPVMLPAPSVQNFIKGQQTYDAELMWEAFSTSYQATQLQRGASKATLQEQADRERSAGLRYVNYAYVGGVPLDNGGSMYFYAVDLELRGQREKMPVVFTVDSDNKLINVTSVLGE